MLSEHGPRKLLFSEEVRFNLSLSLFLINNFLISSEEVIAKLSLSLLKKLKKTFTF